MLASAAVCGALVLRAQDTVQVLTVVRDIPAGTVIASEDLAIADIRGSGVSAVPATAAADVIGQTAATTITKGSLLAAAMLTPEPVPGQGQLAVGLSLASGAFPVDELRAGHAVTIFRVPAANGGEEAIAAAIADPVLVSRAEVLSVKPDESGGKWLVTLVVDEGSAAGVVRAAATDTVGLGLLPVGS